MVKHGDTLYKVFHPIPSHPIPSHPIPSHPILSYATLSLMTNASYGKLVRNILGISVQVMGFASRPLRDGVPSIHLEPQLLYSRKGILRTSFIYLEVHRMHITPQFTSPYGAIPDCIRSGFCDILGTVPAQITFRCDKHRGKTHCA